MDQLLYPFNVFNDDTVEKLPRKSIQYVCILKLNKKEKRLNLIS